MKTKLRQLGLFSDIQHGDPKFPTLKDSENCGDYDSERLGRYLVNGIALVVSPGPLFDPLDEQNKKPLPPEA
jgi:hypothetical protein